jgi:uncharacterized protein YjbI with pentapeptide repeats
VNTDLRGANFKGANLYKANFKGANLVLVENIELARNVDSVKGLNK